MMSSLSVHMLCQFLGILFSGVKLELHNIPFISFDLLLVADINLLRALGDQSHVVANHDHTTGKTIHASSQSINGLHIQGIGWFVQHEKVGLGHRR